MVKALWLQQGRRKPLTPRRLAALNRATPPGAREVLMDQWLEKNGSGAPTPSPNVIVIDSAAGWPHEP